MIAPMSVTAVARSSQDAYRTEVLVGGRHTVVVDEPEDVGGTDEAPTPYQYLAASLASCIVITMRMYARRKGWELGEIAVEVCMDREPSPARCVIEVTLPDGLTVEQRERFAHVANACPVHRTLERPMDFEFSLR